MAHTSITHRCIVFLLLVLFFLSLFSPVKAYKTNGIFCKTDISTHFNYRALVSHKPLRINNDSEFNTMFPNRTIECLEINGTGYGYCIFIGNCSQAFTIKDCFLHNASGNITPYSFNTGLYLYHSLNAIISNNSFSGNDDGISLWDSTDNIIENNSCTSNFIYGISLFSSYNNIIKNNKLFNCGLNLEGTRIYHFNMNVIGQDNTVNNKPICYMKNQTNSIIPDGIGQVFLANCSGITIKNRVFSNCSVGIVLAFTNKTVISNNIFYRNTDGISCLYSNNNTITNNSYNIGSYSSFYSMYSDNNVIVNNSCLNYNGSAIQLFKSNDNIIKSNNYSENGCGIYIEYSGHCLIIDNYCCINEQNGITVLFSFDIKIYGNNCIKNKQNGMWIIFAGNNDISENNFINNKLYGIDISNPFPPTISNCNRIYLNNLIDNNGATSKFDGSHIQVRDETGTNYWNNSEKGNYWSDWTGPDNNHDGIVDAAYILDGGAGAKDYYPLANPVVVTEFSPVSIILLSVILITMVLVWFRRTK